jgi:RNase P subunit RPR2
MKDDEGQVRTVYCPVCGEPIHITDESLSIFLEDDEVWFTCETCNVSLKAPIKIDLSLTKVRKG